MKLRYILNEIKLNSSIIKNYFEECIRKYFPKYLNDVKEWGYPEFKFKEMPSKAGLFRYIPNKGKISNPVLSINRDFNDPEFCRQIVFHETIHYIQANLVARHLPPYIDGKWRVDHDDYFKEMMNKINDSEGTNYITVTHDANGINPSLKNEIYVYGFITNSDKYNEEYYAYVWSNKPNETIIKWLEQNKNKYKQIFNFKTTDMYFKTPKQQIKGSSLKFGVVEDESKKKYINNASNI